MHYTSLSLFSVSLAVSSGYSLLLNTPDVVVTGEPLEITFLAQPGDKPFSIGLFNPGSNNLLGLANNVNPDQGSVTVTVPCVPVTSGYTLEAVKPTDINVILAETAEFTVTQGPQC